MSAALGLSLVIAMAADGSVRAQDISTSGCVGNWTSLNCMSRWGPAADPYIRNVPPPRGRAARLRARERERRWVDRCQPVIRQDRYGVGRYSYAMRGCEFGLGEY